MKPSHLAQEAPLARLRFPADFVGSIRGPSMRVDLPQGGQSGVAAHTTGAAPARSIQHIATDLGKMMLLGGLYYAAASVSLRVALVGGQVTPIWPPTGIALVGLLLFGRKLWPGVALGAFLVNAPIGPSLLTAGGIAVR